jgi:hypothetical protein
MCADVDVEHFLAGARTHSPVTQANVFGTQFRGPSQLDSDIVTRF